MEISSPQASLAPDVEPVVANATTGFDVSSGQATGTNQVTTPPVTPATPVVASPVAPTAPAPVVDKTEAFKAAVAAEAKTAPKEDFSLSKDKSLETVDSGKIASYKTSLEKQIDATNDYIDKVEKGIIVPKATISEPSPVSAMREVLNLSDRGAFNDSVVFNTILPFEFLTKNDANIGFYSDQAELRANNQSVGDKAANGILQGIANVGLNIARDVAYLGGLVYTGAIGAASLVSDVESESIWDVQKNNIAVKAIDEMVTDLDKALPLYKTREEQENPFTINSIFDADFLFGTVIKDALPFLASSMIEGYGIGNVLNAGARSFMIRQLGADAVAAIEAGKVGSSVDDLAKIGIFNAKNVNTAVREGTTMLLNSGEAFMEAGHAYEESKERIKVERLQYLNNVNKASLVKKDDAALEKEAEDYAEKSATDVFKLTFLSNLALLRATEIITPLVVKPFGMAQSSRLGNRLTDYIEEFTSKAGRAPDNKFVKGLKTTAKVAKVLSAPLKDAAEEVGQSGISSKYKDIALQSANQEYQPEEKTFFDVVLGEDGMLRNIFTTPFYNIGSQEWAVEALVGFGMGSVGIKNSIKELQETSEGFKRLKETLSQNSLDFDNFKPAEASKVVLTPVLKKLIKESLGETSLDSYEAAGKDATLRETAITEITNKLIAKKDNLVGLLSLTTGVKETPGQSLRNDAFVATLQRTSNYEALKLIAAKTNDPEMYAVVAKSQTANLYWDYKSNNKLGYLAGDLKFSMDKLIASGVTDETLLKELNANYQATLLNIKELDKMYDKIDRKYNSFPEEVRRNLFVTAESQRNIDAEFEKLRKKSPDHSAFAETYEKRQSTNALINKADELGLSKEIKDGLLATFNDLSTKLMTLAAKPELISDSKRFDNLKQISASLRQYYATQTSAENYQILTGKASQEIVAKQTKELADRIQNALILSKIDAEDRKKYKLQLGKKVAADMKAAKNKPAASTTPTPPPVNPPPTKVITPFVYAESLIEVEDFLKLVGVNPTMDQATVVLKIQEYLKVNPVSDFLRAVLKTTNVFEDYLTDTSPYVRVNGTARMYDYGKSLLDSFLNVVNLNDAAINEAFKKADGAITTDFMIMHLGLSPKVIEVAKMFFKADGTPLNPIEFIAKKEELKQSTTIKNFDGQNFGVFYPTSGQDVHAITFALMQMNLGFVVDNSKPPVVVVTDIPFVYPGIEADFNTVLALPTEEEIIAETVALVNQVQLAIADFNNTNGTSHSVQFKDAFAYILENASEKQKETASYDDFIDKVIYKFNELYQGSYTDIDIAKLYDIVNPFVEPEDEEATNPNQLAEGFIEAVDEQLSISFEEENQNFSFKAAYKSVNNTLTKIKSFWGNLVTILDPYATDPKGVSLKHSLMDSNKLQKGSTVKVVATKDTYDKFIGAANVNNMIFNGTPLDNYDLTFEQIIATNFVILDEQGRLLGQLPTLDYALDNLVKTFEKEGERLFEFSVVKSQIELDLEELYEKLPENYRQAVKDGLAKTLAGLKLKKQQKTNNFIKLLSVEYISTFIDRAEVLKNKEAGFETTIAFKTDGWYLGQTIIEDENGDPKRASPNNRKPFSKFFKNKSHAKGAFYVKKPNVSFVENSKGKIQQTELNALTKDGAPMNFTGAVFFLNMDFDGNPTGNNDLPLLVQSYSFNEALEFDTDGSLEALKTGFYKYINAVLGNDEEALAKFKEQGFACNIQEAQIYLDTIFNAQNSLRKVSKNTQTVVFAPSANGVFLKVSKVGSEEVLSGQDALNELFNLYVNYNLNADARITKFPSYTSQSGVNTYSGAEFEYDTFVSDFLYPVKNIADVDNEYITKHSYRVSLTRPWLEEKPIAKKIEEAEAKVKEESPDISDLYLSIGFSENPLIDGFDSLVVQEQAINFFSDSIVKYFEANQNNNSNLVKIVLKDLIDARLTKLEAIKEILSDETNPKYDAVLNAVKEGKLPTADIKQINLMLDTLETMYGPAFEQVFELAVLRLKDVGFKFKPKGKNFEVNVAEATPVTPKKVVKKLVKTPVTNKQTIPQNFVSGVDSGYGSVQIARPEAKQKLGKENPTSLELIQAGFRTRTTRSAKELAKYGLKVGDTIYQTGTIDGKPARILTKITGIIDRDAQTSLFESTWGQEGWTDEGFGNLSRFGKGSAAVIFEVVPEETEVEEEVDEELESEEDFDQEIDFELEEALEEETEDFADGYGDVDSNVAEALFSDGNKLKVSDKRNIKASLFRLLSTVVKIKDNLKTYTAFGFEDTHSFDDLYNLIRGALKNAPADFNKMMEILESKSKTNPELLQVVQALRSTTTKGLIYRANPVEGGRAIIQEVDVQRDNIEQLQNQFVLRFSSQEAETHFVNFKTQDGVNTFKTLSSNSNTGFRQVLGTISENQRKLASDLSVPAEKKLFVLNEFGDVIVNTVIAKKYYNRLLGLKTPIANEKYKTEKDRQDAVDNAQIFVEYAKLLGIPLTVEDLIGDSTLPAVKTKQNSLGAASVVLGFYSRLMEMEDTNMTTAAVVKRDFYLNKLAQSIAEKYNYNSSQYLNVAGEKVQTTTQPSYLFNRIQEILDPTSNLLNELLTIPGYKNSYLLNWIKDNRDNPAFVKDALNLAYLDGFKTELGGVGLSKMDDISFTITALHLFANNNKGANSKDGKRIGKIVSLTFSDKTTKPIFTAPLAKPLFGLSDTKIVDAKVIDNRTKPEIAFGLVLKQSELLESLTNAVLDELDRISNYATIELQGRGDEVGLSEKELIGGRLIYSFPRLNLMLKNRDVFGGDYTINSNNEVVFTLRKETIEKEIRRTLVEQANLLFNELVQNTIINTANSQANQQLSLFNNIVARLENARSENFGPETEELIAEYRDEALAFVKDGVNNSFMQRASEELSTAAIDLLDEFMAENQVKVNPDKITFNFLDKSVLEPYNDAYGPEFTEEQKVKMFLVDFVGNDALVKMNMFQLLGKTPAHNYKAKNHLKHEFQDPLVTYESMKDKAQEIEKNVRVTMGESTKRLGGVVGPGDPNVDQENKNYIFVDDIISNEYDQNYKDNFGVNGYNDVKLTDGAEIISYPEYIKEQHFAGHITDEEYKKAWSEYESGAYEAVDYVYPIPVNAVKPIYYTSLTDTVNGVASTKYIKSAAFVLIPQLTSYNKNYNDLRLIMEGKSDIYPKGKTIRLVFNSAVKEGAANSVKLFETKNGVKTINIEAITAQNVNSLPAKGYLIQQQVPVKLSTKEISMVTQMTKMLFEGLTDMDITVDYIDPETKVRTQTVKGSTLQDHFDSIRKLQLDQKLKEFLNEFKSEDSDYIDVEKVQQLLLEEGLKRGLSPSVLEQLTIKDGAFELPLIYNSNLPKIESLLSSIIESRVVKQKVLGKSYVQFPGDMFLPQTREEMDASGITFVVDKNGVPLYDPKKGLQHTSTKIQEGGEVLEGGEITETQEVITSAQVILPFDFFDNLGTKLKMEEILSYDAQGRTFIDLKKIPRSLLEHVASRIPHQGASSMILYEVVGFLPKGVVNIAFVSGQVTAQMGSDFDVDKLYTYKTPFVKYKKGTVTKLITPYLLDPSKQIDDTELYLLAKKFQADLRKKKVSISIKEAKKVILAHSFVATHKYLLKTKDFVKKSLTPLDQVGISNAAAKRQNTDNKNIKLPFGFAYQKNLLAANKDGKVGVGIFSSGIVTTAAISRGNIKISFGINLQDSQGNPIYANTLTGETKNADGSTRADLLRDAQSQSVDNANNQMLGPVNLSKDTFSYYSMLASLADGSKADGENLTTVDYIIDLLTQPFVKRLIDYGNTVKLTNPFMSKEAVFDEFMKANFTTKQLIDFDAIYTSKENVSQNRTVTKEELVEMATLDIKNYDKKQVDVDYARYKTLKMLMRLNQATTSFLSLSAVINPDSRGVDKNLVKSLLTMQTALKESNKLDGFSEFFIGSVYETYFNNTVRGFEFMSNIYSPLSSYYKDNVLDVFNTLFDQELNNNELLALHESLLKVKQLGLANAAGKLVETPISNYDAIRALLNPNSSFFAISYLDKMLKENPDNKFLRLVTSRTVATSPKKSFTLAVRNISIEDRNDDLVIQEAFMKLYENPLYSDFMKKFVYYNKTVLSNSPLYTFDRFIPMKVLRELKFVQAAQESQNDFGYNVILNTLANNKKLVIRKSNANKLSTEVAVAKTELEKISAYFAEFKPQVLTTSYQLNGSTIKYISKIRLALPSGVNLISFPIDGKTDAFFFSQDGVNFVKVPFVGNEVEKVVEVLEPNRIPVFSETLVPFPNVIITEAKETQEFLEKPNDPLVNPTTVDEASKRSKAGVETLADFKFLLDQSPDNKYTALCSGLISILREQAKVTGVEVAVGFVEKKGNVLGSFLRGSKPKITIADTNKRVLDTQLTKTFSHEAIHAITETTISLFFKDEAKLRETNPKAHKAITNLLELYHHSKKKLTKSSRTDLYKYVFGNSIGRPEAESLEYGFKEFITHALTDTIFQKWLNETASPEGFSERKSILSSIVEKIINIMKALFSSEMNEGFVLDDAILEAAVLLENSIIDYGTESTEGNNDVELPNYSISFPHLNPVDNDQIDKNLPDYVKTKLNNLYNAYYRAREIASNPKIGLDKKAFEQQAEYLMDAIKAASDGSNIVIDPKGNVVYTEIAELGLQQLSDLRVLVDRHGVPDINNVVRHVTPQELLFINQQVELWEDALDLMANTPEKSEVIVALNGLAKATEDIMYDVYTNSINQTVPFDELKVLTREELEKTTPVSSWSLFALDMSRTNNKMLTTLDLILKNAARDVNGEYQQTYVPKIKELKDALKAAGYDPEKQETWDLFLQEDANGKPNGLVVNKYNSYYFKTIQNKLLKFIKTTETDPLLAKKDRIKQNREKLKWANQNLEIADVSYLEEADPVVQEAMKKAAFDVFIKLGLVEEDVTSMFEEAEQKYDNYQRKLERFVEKFKQDNGFDEAANKFLNPDGTDNIIATVNFGTETARFSLKNNPVTVIKNIKNPAAKFKFVHNFNFLVYVPKKTSPEYDKFTDDKYKVIEQNPALFNYYKFFVDTMSKQKKLIPRHNLKGIPRTYIPEVVKGIYEDAVKNSGLKGAVSYLTAPFVQAFAGNNWLSKDRNVEQDLYDAAGNRLRSVPLVGITYRQQKLQKAIDRQARLIATLRSQPIGSVYAPINMKNLKFNITPALFEVEERRLEYMKKELEEFTKVKSFNIDEALNSFVLTTLNYKHKTSVEPVVLLGQAILNKAKVDAKSPSGKVLTQRGVELANQKELENVTKLLEYNINSILYNERKAEEMVTTKEFATGEDGAVKFLDKTLDELKQKIKAIKDIEEKNRTPEQEKDLILLEMELQYTKRGSFSVSKLLDQVIKIQQLKSLGLDPFQASADFTASMVQLTIQASGQNNFDGGALTKAFGLLLNSTKNMLGMKNPTGTKIVNLMNKFSLVGEIIEANYGTAQTELTKQWGLDPFAMLRVSNFFSTGTLMVANLLHKKVTINGKEMTLWDAFDENGNFIDKNDKDWNGAFDAEGENEAYRKLRNSLVQQLKQVTGNADVNSPILAKKYILGRLLGQFRLSWIPEGVAARFEDEKFDAQLGTTVKGRYRTLYEILKKDRFASVNHLFMLAVGSKKNGLKLSDLDIRNMKKNFAELYWFATISAGMILLKMLAEGGDDDEKNYAAITVYNQLNRVMSDIKFYASPQTAEDIIKNPIPALKVYKDAARAITAVKNYMTDEEGGYDYDAQYLGNRLASPFPYVNMYPKVVRQASEVIEN